MEESKINGEEKGIHYATMVEYSEMTDKEARQYLKYLKDVTLQLKDAVSKAKNPVTMSVLRDHMGMVTQYTANKYRSAKFVFRLSQISLNKAKRQIARDKAKNRSNGSSSKNEEKDS